MAAPANITAIHRHLARAVTDLDAATDLSNQAALDEIYNQQLGTLFSLTRDTAEKARKALQIVTGIRSLG